MKCQDGLILHYMQTFNGAVVPKQPCRMFRVGFSRLVTTSCHGRPLPPSMIYNSNITTNFPCRFMMGKKKNKKVFSQWPEIKKINRSISQQNFDALTIRDSVLELLCFIRCNYFANSAISAYLCNYILRVECVNYFYIQLLDLNIPSNCIYV